MAGTNDIIGIAAAIAKSVPGTAGATAVAAKEAAVAAAAEAQEILESIPEDYSELSADVGDLKSATEDINCYYPIADSTKDITLAVDANMVCTFNGTSDSNIVYSRIPMQPGTYKYTLNAISGTGGILSLRYGTSSGTEWANGTTVTFAETTKVFIRANAGTYENYKVQFLVQKIGALITAVDIVARSAAIATPELYGAVGNGVVDDYYAITKALAYNKVVALNGNYLTSISIDIPADRRLIINGSLTYSGNDTAINIAGANVSVDGIGTITSSGKYGIKIAADVSEVEIGLQGKIYCRSSSAIAVVYIYANDYGITKLHLHDMYLVGGDSSESIADGIYIDNDTDGWINSNAFDRIKMSRCNNAIKIVNGSSNSINENYFRKINAENSTKQIYAYCTSTGIIIGNEFELRTNEQTNNAGVIDIDGFSANRFVFSSMVRPSIFTNTTNPTKEFYSSSALADNQIIGIMSTTTGSAICVNPSFKMNGNAAVLNFRGGRTITSYIDTNITFNWSNSIDLLPGIETYVISASTCTIDLNYLSDWNTSPLQYIEIASGSDGTTLTIVNGTTTVYAQTQLSAGIYKVFYKPNKREIRLVKIS